ncbi:unnamed protein product [Larinioides sclopetarius]
MVVKSMTTLKERGGSSLQAIKKHISSEYKVDIDRLTPFIKKYLKSAVAAGTLVQTKGKGANGSFKLSASGQKTKEPKKTVKKVKKEGAASPKKAKAPAKKTAKPKEKAEKKKNLQLKNPLAERKKLLSPNLPRRQRLQSQKPPSQRSRKLPKKQHLKRLQRSKWSEGKKIYREKKGHFKGQNIAAMI